MSKNRKHPKNDKVKKQLFLKCGTVDMYNMQIYKEHELTLHHYPPFRETKHTIFNESYLVTRENHDTIELEEKNEPDKYEETMKQIIKNKKILIKMKLTTAK